MLIWNFSQPTIFPYDIDVYCCCCCNSGFPFIFFFILQITAKIEWFHACLRLSQSITGWKDCIVQHSMYSKNTIVQIWDDSKRTINRRGKNGVDKFISFSFHMLRIEYWNSNNEEDEANGVFNREGGWTRIWITISSTCKTDTFAAKQ